VFCESLFKIICVPCVIGVIGAAYHVNPQFHLYAALNLPNPEELNLAASSFDRLRMSDSGIKRQS